MAKIPGWKIRENNPTRTKGSSFNEVIQIYILEVLGMDEEIGRAMDEILLLNVENLRNLSPGSEVKASEVENVAKLYKARLEYEKNELDRSEKAERLKLEAEKSVDEATARQTELEIRKKEKCWERGIAIGTTAVNLAWMTFMIVKGFKFEEEGVFRSKTLDKLSRMKFFKK